MAGALHFCCIKVKQRINVNLQILHTMRKSFQMFAATLILAAGFHMSLQAQKTATWKGGAPGRNNDWNCAANWKEGRVPNEFSDVLIFKCDTPPVISRRVAGVNALTLLPGAQLCIEKAGVLVVFDRVEIHDGSHIQNKGVLNMPLADVNLMPDQKGVLAIAAENY